jgi:hypothetical protein
MTAAELNAYSAELTEATQQVEGATEQVRITGLVFDYDAPLPDLHIRQARSWEPAARHYRDLTEEERAEQ